MGVAGPPTGKKERHEAVGLEAAIGTCARPVSLVPAFPYSACSPIEGCFVTSSLSSPSHQLANEPHRTVNHEKGPLPQSVTEE
ncbi:hypothetical protein VTK73DRAFT_998 [Phialemonium thermophilum]|uniref:Uncharacterized protein n=1 Tax=Phialemonium thermophilum TaxID=223376 RepID=A0ABR3VU74_9PEZI